MPALYLITKSSAPMATDITIQMVEVYSAYRNGQLGGVAFSQAMVMGGIEANRLDSI